MKNPLYSKIFDGMDRVDGKPTKAERKVHFHFRGGRDLSSGLLVVKFVSLNPRAVVWIWSLVILCQSFLHVLVIGFLGIPLQWDGTMNLFPIPH